MQRMKFGFGYDSHRFLREEELRLAREKAIETETDVLDASKPLILGGEVAEGFPPFKARSDGDVIMHAAVNAILSALALDEARDIGTLFPNTDASHSNQASATFLAHAGSLAQQHGWHVQDLKLTIKGCPRVDLAKVRTNLAEILQIDRECVLVQGTSGEEMDDAGKGKGVEAFGICVLVRRA